MKKISLFFTCAICFAACTKVEVDDSTIIQDRSYTALFDNVESRVHLNDSNKSVWDSDDHISIFETTTNSEYKLSGESGGNKAIFVPVGSSVTGSALSTNYAVYPYNSSTSIATDGTITLSLPSVQAYAEDSYGVGANTMVAATENSQSRILDLKSLGGYVIVKLYGEGKVTSVVFEGNNGEKIAGTATVKPEYGSVPSVTVSESGTCSISVDCGEGVQLGTTAETATEFWFVVPPVTFAKGFTVKAYNTDGNYYRMATTAQRSISRNVIHEFPAANATFTGKDGFVYFADPKFKEYCVKNFDTNKDGEISFDEAKVVKSICCDNMKITSMRGVEYFTALTELEFFRNPLTSLDISKNTALTRLWCAGNQLTNLDVSKNTALTILQCENNQLTSIDISKNIALTWLDCYDNQLTSLDISKNTALTVLQCENNQLTCIDVSKHTALTTLNCGYNQLTNLDVSKNTALTGLGCRNNQLTSIDVSKHTALTWLGCENNQLTSLDISKNIALTRLQCHNNQLSGLDISNNVNLTNMYCHNNYDLKTIYVWSGFKESDYPNFQKDETASYAEKILVTSVTLDKTTASLKIGQTLTLTATVNPSDATEKTVTWTTSDASVATVADGVVTARAAGSATITATAGGKSATCSVTITAPVFEAVDLGLSVKWANWNLGANCESEYGSFYAWGEIGSKTSFTWLKYKYCWGTSTTLRKYNKDSTYGTVDNKTRLEEDDDVATYNYGSRWHIPTLAEWNELKNNCTWTWATEGGVNGYRVTSNKAGYTDKSIFLPIGGGYDSYSTGKSMTNYNTLGF